MENIANFLFLIMVIWAKITLPTPLNLSEQQIYNMVYSPDHTQIAFTNLDTNGQPTLYIAAADGSQRQVVFSSLYPSKDSSINEITWSPDGDQLIFTLSYFDPSLNGFAVNEILIINADGSDVSISIGKGHWVFAPVWLIDGKHIAFSVGESGCYALYVVDTNGKNLDYLIGCRPIG